MTDKAENDREVIIDKDIYIKIEERVQDTEFKSVDEYTEFVLQEVLAQIEGSNEGNVEQDEEVKDRLKQLGYME